MTHRRLSFSAELVKKVIAVFIIATIFRASFTESLYAKSIFSIYNKDSLNYSFKFSSSYFYNRYNNYFSIYENTVGSFDTPKKEFLRNGLALGVDLSIKNLFFARLDLLSYFNRTLGISRGNMFYPNNNSSVAPGGFSFTLGLKSKKEKLTLGFLIRGGMMKLSEEYELKYDDYYNGTQTAKILAIHESRFAEAGISLIWNLLPFADFYFEPSFMLVNSNLFKSSDSPVLLNNYFSNKNFTTLTIYNFRTGFLFNLNK